MKLNKARVNQVEMQMLTRKRADDIGWGKDARSRRKAHGQPARGQTNLMRCTMKADRT